MEKTTLQILRENGFDRGVIEWENNTIPPTSYWYNEVDNRVYADCGVSIPFIYDIRTQMARCHYDIAVCVEEYYKNLGINVCPIDD